MGSATTAPRLSDWLLAHGHTSVSTARAAELLGIPVGQVRVRLQTPVRDRLLFSPARGLWVPVPPEFRSWGVTPATQFVDDLMRHLNREYYVGWLSAAELHGAAHQRPQVTQVAVDRPTEDRDLGRVRIRFHARAQLERMPRIALQAPTGTVQVSSVELTAVDLADQPARGGGISNVTTVLAHLAADPGLDSERLGAAASLFPAAAGRRLGFLLKFAETKVDTTGLRNVVGSRPLARPPLLTPQGPRRGRVDRFWGVLVNAEVDADL